MNEEKDWYKHRHELEEGDVFITYSGLKVALYQPVPGDDIRWYVAWCCNGEWFYEGATIKLSNLKTRIERHYG